MTRHLLTLGFLLASTFAAGCGGRPAHATDIECAGPEACAPWQCECADGTTVSSNTCSDGFCLDAEGSCPTACERMGHGSWSGRASGGSSKPEPEPPADAECTSHSQCPGYSCACGAWEVTASRCIDFQCADRQAACQNACP